MGFVLIAANAVFAGALALEYLAARGLLFRPEPDWLDQYDSGRMAFVSIATGFGLLVTAVVALAALVVLVVRAAKPTILGWLALAAHAALLVMIWTGAAVPDSAPEFWYRLAIFGSCAATGIVAGLRLPSVRHGGAVEPGADALSSAEAARARQ